MTDILIQRGRVIDPAGGIDKRTDVLISKGKVARIGRVDASTMARSCKIIDARRKLVDVAFGSQDAGDAVDNSFRYARAADAENGSAARR